MIKAGDKAPDFELQDQDGKTHKLSDYKGKTTLVYFYPKDDTPGCTKEACGIRDSFPNFKTQNLVVLGISADSVESHKKFANKYNLPFTLLSDPNREVIKMYGVWQEKNFMGKSYMGIVRSSFLINKEGKVAKVYKNVKPPKHAAEILEDSKAI